MLLTTVRWEDEDVKAIIYKSSWQTRHGRDWTGLVKASGRRRGRTEVGRRRRPGREAESSPGEEERAGGGEEGEEAGGGQETGGGGSGRG